MWNLSFNGLHFYVLFCGVFIQEMKVIRKNESSAQCQGQKRNLAPTMTGNCKIRSQKIFILYLTRF